MAKAYSEDLREKVMSHLMSGCSKRETARIFKIGEATVYRWQKLGAAGNLKPKKRIFYPYKVEEQKLREYMKTNPDDTLEQIGKALGLGRQTVFSWLRRLKITRKKRPRSTENVMKRNGLNLRNSLHK